MTDALRFIPYAGIDQQKWDDRVAASANGFIFSQSFYLNALCEWDALVAGDYEYIMALPRKKKAGFRYVFIPPFTGQLGIIGHAKPGIGLCTAFIKAAARQYAYTDSLLNEDNEAQEGKGIQVQWRDNMVLPLRDSYEMIAGRYSRDALKNLRKASLQGCTIEYNIPPEKVITLYRAAYGRLNRKVSEQDYRKFYALALTAIQAKKGFTVGVNDAGSELVAGAFFGIDNKRLYYILGAPTPAGRQLKAVHYLVDTIIKKYAGTGLLFDFEGSDIESVANFYKKFSPLVRKYPHVKINRLPLLVRWLKK